MKNFLNKIGLIAVTTAALLCGSVNAKAQAVGLLSVSANNPYTNTVLLASPAKVAQLQILAGSTGLVVDLYDNSITNMLYTNASYTNFISYISNYVTTVSGIAATNSTTNVVLYSTGQTVAASTTNVIPFLSFPVQASTLATYPINKMFAKGIAIRVSNTNCSVIVRYRAP